MSLIEKFKKDVSTLRSAANGEIYLDVKNPKLYKKVFRYYQNEGVVFSGEPLIRILFSALGRYETWIICKMYWKHLCCSLCNQI